MSKGSAVTSLLEAYMQTKIVRSFYTYFFIDITFIIAHIPIFTNYYIMLLDKIYHILLVHLIIRIIKYTKNINKQILYF